MTDVVVIGAGPYGLSVAANLLKAGLQVRVFGRAMEMWREHMPHGMVLKSDGFATNFGAMPLTLERFCAETGRAFRRVGHRTPLADLLAYAEMFQRTYVPDVHEQRVVGVRRMSAAFVVTLANGLEVLTKRLVVATGLLGFERLPLIPGLPSHRLAHVSQYHTLDHFRGRRVLILGAGQSAFETAALLHESGAHVQILTRRPPIWFNPESEAVPSAWTRLRHPNFGLGPGWRSWLWSEAPNLFYYLPRRTRVANAYTTFGPAGSGWLKHRVVGTIACTTGRIIGAHEAADEVVIEAEVDGKRASFAADHVIAATGYRPDMRQLSFLSQLLPDVKWLDAGLPVLDRGFETSVAGLHVVGVLSAPSLGPSMRFIYGTNRAGPQLARSLKLSTTQTVVGYRARPERQVVEG